VIFLNKIDELVKYIKESSKTVFFGGAGISTESGLKDFRSKDGLYSLKYDYPPEVILSHNFFMNNTLEFYNFYRDKINGILEYLRTYLSVEIENIDFKAVIDYIKSEKDNISIKELKEDMPVHKDDIISIIDNLNALFNVRSFMQKKMISLSPEGHKLQNHIKNRKEKIYSGEDMENDV